MRILNIISNVSAYGIGIWFILFEFILKNDTHLYIETIGYVALLCGFLYSELMKFLMRSKS